MKYIENLKFIREMGIIRNLSRIIGVRHETIQKWERGEDEPRSKNILKIEAVAKAVLNLMDEINEIEAQAWDGRVRKIKNYNQEK